ncbi:pilus assembly protein TadG-related protein [Sphingomonas sp. FW199]|uniref:Tad domain-containing protein n=1 Tax=Sphingomonas sp. FW199 TaxID=3400217 RepID=UPI003CE6783E
MLTRLARDKRANTLAIMAASLMPLAGLIGGALDLSRLYIVKTRLQHACDAGALAGRKAMGGGIWTQNGGRPNQTAQQFFNANIAPSSFGAESVTATFAETAGKVTGTASATVPMTVMRVLGKEEETLQIDCDAEMRLPNTDVMFVLDVTGSMDDPLPNDTQRKIDGLKTAVLCFYETLARENTAASCVGGDPSGGIGTETQVRFGFVPYASNVNVGRLLNPDWVVDQWTYQSRQIKTVYGVETGFTDGAKGNWSNWSGNVSATTATRAECEALAQPAIRDEARNANAWLGRNEANGGLTSWDGTFQSVRQWRDREYQYVSWAAGNNNCKYRTRTRNYDRTFDFRHVQQGTANARAFNAWEYKPVQFNVSGLKNGTTWNNSISLPINNNFGNSTINWAGCIEERDTVRATSYYPIDADAIDLDIDRVPSTGDDRTRWRPALAVTYQRKVSSDNNNARSLNTITSFTNFSGGSFACPVAATKLTEWASASAFETYVNALTPNGNTYHDIGLIWGGRLMSPTGLFASENRFTPEGGEIERHLVFMTDGDACTNVNNYQAYGLAWYDRRQTDPDIEPTEGCSTTGTLTEQVNARTQAICTAIKNKNITLWVIWYGTSNTTIEGQMTTCASSGRFFSARNSTQLQETFRDIANQISQLRLTS